MLEMSLYNTMNVLTQRKSFKTSLNDEKYKFDPN